ncbi:MAG: discoidin domain-containing protein [Bacteroidota bacterium]
MREIGEWLELNGDAVYGTQAGPFPFLSWGRSTMKGQKLYLHVFDWPEDGRLVVPFSNQIIRAHLMADPNTDLQVTKGEGKSIISLPSYAPDKIASVIELEYEGIPDVKPIPSNGALVSASILAAGSEASFLTDGDSNNRWSAPEGEKMGMLEIDLGEAVDIQCLTVVEPWYPWDHMSQELELQYLAGKEWKSIFTTKTKGTGHTKAFTPLKAQKFRLIVKNEQKPPSLKELILFRAE